MRLLSINRQLLITNPEKTTIQNSRDVFKYGLVSLDMLQHHYCKFVTNLYKFVCEVPRCAKPSQKLQNHVFILTCFLSCSCTWTDLYLNNRIFVTEAKVYLCMHSLNVIVLIFWSFPSFKNDFYWKDDWLGWKFLP